MFLLVLAWGVVGGGEAAAGAGCSCSQQQEQSEAASDSSRVGSKKATLRRRRVWEVVRLSILFFWMVLIDQRDWESCVLVRANTYVDIY